MSVKKIQPLIRSKFSLIRFASQEHSAIVPSNIKKKDLTNPDLWSHVRPNIRAFDEIRVIPENAEYRAKLFVSHVDGKNLKLELIEYTEFTKNQKERKLSQFDIEQKGQLEWCITDVATGDIVVPTVGKTKPQAIKALQSYRASTEPEG